MSLWMIGLVLIWVVGGSIFVCKRQYAIDIKEKTRIKQQENKSTPNHIKSNIIYMYNESLNIKKPYHKGFSWTVLLFGFIPAIFREDWKYALIMFVLSLCTAGLSNIYFAIKYNEIYIRELEQKGYIIMQ